MFYQRCGTAALSEFLGDFVVYRNLVSPDPRLPTLEDLRPVLGLPEKYIPRKADAEYGQVMAAILSRARRLDAPGTSIKRLLFIGDTRMNDGTAFRTLCAAGGWEGWAFIGYENLNEPWRIQVEDRIYFSNRWSSLLTAFLDFLRDQEFPLDEETVAVIDIDKTAIGARGRNDRVIDEARVEGLQRTVADVLGPAFDLVRFREIYDELKQPAYHPFTSDNQDYLAYICLFLSVGIFSERDLVREIRAGTLRHFTDFLEMVQARRFGLPNELRALHDDIWWRVREGDPTPFKAFRYNEYLSTISRFGNPPSEQPVEDVLRTYIVLTQEVREIAHFMARQGVLLFGISDKPDEASIPAPDQARRGMRALHQAETISIAHCLSPSDPPGLR